MDNGALAVLKRNDVNTGINTSSSAKCYPVFIEKCTPLTTLPSNEDQEESRKLLKCGICTEVFISIHDISNHLQHQHQNIQVFDCGICLKFFPLHDELETHLLENHLQCDSGPTLVIKAPNIDVAEIENFIRNSEFREKVELECPFCKCVYNKLALYQQHMSASHRGKAWDKDGLCNAILKVTTVKTSSVKPVIRDDPNEVAPGKVYTCGHCNKKVFGKESMKRHIASHRDSTIIQCAICYEFFISESTFVNHRRTVHLSLNNLNLKQNRHGDIIGSSLEDVLKANDCLSRSSRNEVEKQQTPVKSQIKSTLLSRKGRKNPKRIDLDAENVQTNEFTTIDCKTDKDGKKVVQTIAGTKQLLSESPCDKNNLQKDTKKEKPQEIQACPINYRPWSDVPEIKRVVSEVEKQEDLPEMKEQEDPPEVKKQEDLPDIQIIGTKEPQNKGTAVDTEKADIKKFTKSHPARIPLIDKIANELDKVDTGRKSVLESKTGLCYDTKTEIYEVKNLDKDENGTSQCEKIDNIAKENISTVKHPDENTKQDYYRATWYLAVRYLLTALASMAAFQQYYSKMETSTGQS